MLYNILSVIPLFITTILSATLEISIGEMNGMGFLPAVATATVGDTISFTWFKGIHNVVQASNRIYCDSAIPNGITSGNPVEEPGLNFNFTIMEPGYFFYFCQVHCLNGMKGEIYVTAASPEPTGTTTTTWMPMRTNDPYMVLKYPSEGSRSAEHYEGIVANFLRGLQFVPI